MQEKIDAVKWFHTHPCNYKNKKLTLKYNYYSIGTVIKAVCSCGKVEDVTDYVNW